MSNLVYTQIAQTEFYFPMDGKSGTCNTLQNLPCGQFAFSLSLPPCVPTGKDIGALVSNVGSGAAAAAAAAPSGGGGGAEEEKKEVEEEKKKEESEEESDEDMGFGMCVCVCEGGRVRGQRGECEGAEGGV